MLCHAARQLYRRNAFYTLSASSRARAQGVVIDRGAGASRLTERCAARHGRTDDAEPQQFTPHSLIKQAALLAGCGHQVEGKLSDSSPPLLQVQHRADNGDRDPTSSCALSIRRVPAQAGCAPACNWGVWPPDQKAGRGRKAAQGLVQRNQFCQIIVV